MNAARKQIYQFLLEGIAQGRYGLNDRVPTEQELGVMFDTPRMNAHYAVNDLRDRGILRRRRKHGTFVDRVPSTFQLGELKSLATRRVCVLNDTPQPYRHIHWNQRLVGPLENGLRDAGIEVLFENISHLKTIDEYRAFLSKQLDQGCNALIWVPNRSSPFGGVVSAQPELLFEFHDNVFIFDRGVHDWNAWPYNIVSINVFGEGVTVARYLLERKVEHVFFCYWNGERCSWSQERMTGLRFGLHREDQSSQSLRCRSNDRQKWDPAFFDEVIQCISQGATALVGHNDEVAVALVDEANRRGLRPGRDLSIIGFDDDSKYQPYNLTTVSPSLERIGCRLAELIKISLDTEEQQEVTCTKINSELKIRATG